MLARRFLVVGMARWNQERGEGIWATILGSLSLGSVTEFSSLWFKLLGCSQKGSCHIFVASSWLE